MPRKNKVLFFCSGCFHIRHSVCKYAGDVCAPCWKVNNNKKYPQHAESRKAWAVKNREKFLGYRSKYRNSRKEEGQEYRKKYKAKNRGLVAGHESLRRGRKKRALLKGVCPQEILSFYRKCPPGMQVDHIVPLAGKEVCGLHVPWNFQYLTPSENLKKGNKLCSH